MKSGHSVWAKYREASEVIDLHELFSDYWSSNKDEFTVMSQLSHQLVRVYHLIDRQSQLPLESIVALWKYDSLRIIPFVLLPLAIPAS